MWRITLSFLMVFLTACTTVPQTNILILNYEDFGPPVVANEVIGMDWWQWQKVGNSRPQNYAIKVAVYRGLSIDTVKALYPVNQEKKQDYRYLEYATAMNYLDKIIEEDVLSAVTEKLTITRKRLTNRLNSH